MTGPLSRGTAVVEPAVLEDGTPTGRLIHRCPECGEVHALDVDPGKLKRWLTLDERPHVQDYWQELSSAEREEFFMTGTCGKCWDRIFKEEQ